LAHADPGGAEGGAAQLAGGAELDTGLTGLM
jgi:hypothetical protein